MNLDGVVLFVVGLGLLVVGAELMRHVLGEHECRRRQPLLRDRLVPRSCSAILRIIPMACKQITGGEFQIRQNARRLINV